MGTAESPDGSVGGISRYRPHPPPPIPVHDASYDDDASYRRLAENYRAAEQRRLAEDDIASSTVLTAVSVSVLIVLGLVLYERKKAERKWTILRTTHAYMH